MDLRTLYYFLTVAEERNITNAASKLHMSQPPLSRQMTLLEEEVGTPLLIRSPHGIELTEAGIFLESRAKDLIYARDKILDEMRGFKDGAYEKISLGIIDSISMSYLPDAICSFMKSNPRVNFSLLTEVSERICELVDSNIMDLGIVRLNIDESFYDYIPFQRDSWMAIMSKDNPLAGTEVNEMSAGMLAGQPLILPSKYSGEHELRKSLRELDIKFRAIIHYSSLSMGILLAEKNVGICISPSSMLPNVRQRSNIVTKRIVHPSIYTTASLIWKKNRVQSPAVRRFIDFMTMYLKDHPSYTY